MLKPKNHILKEVFNDFEKCVLKPDHPFLLQDPDIIAADEGKLLCLFFPTAAELENDQLLKQRVALARVALPTEAAFILATKQEDLAQFRYDFDHTVVGNEIFDLRKILHNHSVNSNHTKQIAKLKKEFFHRYAVIQQNHVKLQFPEDEKIYQSKTKRSRKTSKGYTWKQYKSLNISSGNFTPRAAKENLRSLTTDAIAHNYTIDSGIFYDKNDSPHVVLGFSFAKTEKDPLKLRSASALAGLFVVEEPINDQQLQMLSRNLSREWRKNLK